MVGCLFPHRERQPRNTGITVITLTASTETALKKRSFRETETERETAQEHRHNCHNTHSFYRNSPQEKELQRDTERDSPGTQA